MWPEKPDRHVYVPIKQDRLAVGLYIQHQRDYEASQSQAGPAKCRMPPPILKTVSVIKISPKNTACHKIIPIHLIRRPLSAIRCQGNPMSPYR